MSRYLVTFFFTVLVDGRADPVDLKRDSWLPFVPRVADMIAVTAADDFRKVESVWWVANHEGFKVHFEFEPKRRITRRLLKKYRALGWEDAKP